ncbi:hypothetical protein SMD44_04466 [Streptomyces alboflavus]|uniref:Uncharacterized protein n=1 Tax=Streptomyces alboflavus TaxID=67267 RepID=A0A1Z1WF58_9ACTN|nr:hypothetical protein SMD44_04466 [Streptomyces alboflavus]
MLMGLSLRDVWVGDRPRGSDSDCDPDCDLN